MFFELPDLPIDAIQYEAELLRYFTTNFFNHELQGQSVKTQSQKLLTCLSQEKLKQNYEVELFENGNIATREYNWHDYFNLCVWVSYPRTKAAINYLHYSEIKNKKQKNRTSLENAMTIFDENGVVVLCSDEKLLDMTRRHEWKKLFWDYREDVKHKMHIAIIGHSLYEKFLNPYIGMTAHAVLWHVEEVNLEKYELDARLAQELNSKIYSSPKSLQPLPILGYPDWFSENKYAEFYDDTRYFRPLRRL